MRSLDQCKNEIMKKSREQIKRRKKIKISLICLTLCIISLPLIITGLNSPSKSANEAPENAGDCTEIKACAEIYFDGQIKKTEDKEVYNKLYSELINLFDDKSNTSSPDSFTGEIKIRLYDEAGEHIYIINDNFLRDENTGAEVFISSDKIKNLLTLWG